MKIVAVSGYFDPFHVGHLDYFEMAKGLGGYLIVIVNSDHQARQKYGEPQMSEADRVRLIGALEIVDKAVLSIDDDMTQCETLSVLKPDIFANGGDRHLDDIPEVAVCIEHGIELVDGLGEKIRSSSDYR